MIEGLEKSSFRDRDGFVFYRGNTVYRAIHSSYSTTWNDLSGQDFFKALRDEGKLPAFEEAAAADLLPGTPGIYQVLKVETIPFISYPHEWSFAQLKKAALLTLALQKKALENNFTLKDASAYNVQFKGPKAVFIDLLSFDRYTEGEPWAAYGQFCRHFLAPLLLAAKGPAYLPSLFVSYADGMPLPLASAMLPWSTRFSMLAYTHIHLHARFENRHGENKSIRPSGLQLSKARSLAIIEHLQQGIRQLTLRGKNTNWTGYYDTCSYTAEGYAFKKTMAEKHMADNAGRLCLDLGANTGEFSELAAKHFKQVVACDSDMEVVRAIQAKKTGNVLALRVDLSNPGPAYGWNGEERRSFLQRAQGADLVLALALVHHLCIGNNVPLGRLAAFFAGFARTLLVEFVPKSDVQVKKLLVTRKDIFGDYDYENFKAEFGRQYVVVDEQRVPGSERVLFFLKKKQA